MDRYFKAREDLYYFLVSDLDFQNPTEILLRKVNRIRIKNHIHEIKLSFGDVLNSIHNNVETLTDVTKQIDNYLLKKGLPKERLNINTLP
jgi:hypothetical protein